MRETALGAYAHQDLPFEKLVEELHPERDLGRTPLFQVMFNLVNLEAHPTRLEGLAVETLPNPAPESKFDLTLYALDGPAGIQLVAVYNADLYERERVGEILAQLEQVLGQAVASPEAPIDLLSLVTPAARRRLPDPALPLARATCETVTARLAVQARRVPSRPAVVDRRGSWSYEELHLASSRLAGHLQALGITRGDVVAIHGQRSAALVGALLGVLKAGGAFLILDPAYPALRTIECLRQAQPKAFIQLAAAGPLAAALEDFVPAGRVASSCPRTSDRAAPGRAGPWRPSWSWAGRTWPTWPSPPGRPGRPRASSARTHRCPTSSTGTRGASASRSGTGSACSPGSRTTRCCATCSPPSGSAPPWPSPTRTCSPSGRLRRVGGERGA